MGTAIDACTDGLRLTARNPVYVGVTFVVGIVLLVLSLLGALIPLLGPLVVDVLVMPVLVAGLLGMADAARRGGASLGDFSSAVSAYYKRMIAAFALLYGGAIAVGIVLVVVAVFFGLFAVGLGQVAGSGAGLGPALAGMGVVMTGLFVVVGLLLLVASIVLQFVGPAIVVGEEDAFSSFRASWRLFAGAPLSVVGYTLLVALVGVVGLLVPLVVGAVGYSLGGRVPAFVLAGLASLPVTPFVYGFVFAAQVSYYASRTGDPTTGGPDDGTAAGVAPTSD